ncbi:MAG: acyl-CoA thioesterase/BAAT N-terminal domain-containing protein [Curvibacter sp.]|nr:acyl-CoA thioesterase/BAAT N-terminal domain-containing protein [Curvibacter sp.]
MGALVPRIEVSPADALIDVPRRIQVQGLAPGEVVCLQSRTLRGPSVPWQASVRFQADPEGQLDLGRQAPLAGEAYAGVSPMGLIWAQSPLQAGASREVFASEPGGALHTELSLWRDGEPCASATLVQRLAAPGVQRQEIRSHGLVGSLWLPPGPGPHPAVLVLNGSGGGINESRAALYASRGYAALALAYFKAPGLSDYISNTPLEYFETALEWMHRELQPRQGFVAVSGQSRGGELALLLASRFASWISAVVGYVPSAVVNCAQNACDPALGREGWAWLHHGQPIPHVWQGNRFATWAPWDQGPEPRRHSLALLTSLQDAEAVERARIPVERIQAPVLLLTAGDDGSWPSSLYGRMVVERLEQAGHPWPVAQIDYPQAGHSIVLPCVPTTQLVYAHPVSGRLSTTGGRPQANAEADQHSWSSVLEFLQQAQAARSAHRRH